MSTAATTPAHGGEKKSMKKEMKLEKEAELRCQVEWEQKCSIKLLTGTAEIFGTEIAQGQAVAFHGGEKLAVFTWHGATVEVEGSPDLPDALYVADETPMVTYINVHAILNARRQEASALLHQPNQHEQQIAELSAGPRVMLVGPVDSGKSTLARILTNYAARSGWKATIVDLDVEQNLISVPGTIAAVPVEGPMDADGGVPQDAAIVFFYGHTNPGVAPDVYRANVTALAGVINQQLEGNGEGNTGGLIVNTMGWVDGLGYQLLLHAINAFEINIVLVLGQDLLHSQLTDAFRSGGGEGEGGHGVGESNGGRRKRAVEVVKLSQSGGVVRRGSKHRQKARLTATRAYFYGKGGDLLPHVWVASWTDVRVYKVGGGPQVPRSALPIGAEPTADPLKITPVAISRELVHSVLAVSWAKEQGDILESNIAGFVYVTEVDIARKKLTLVAPSPGPLPNNILLSGSITWVE